MIENAESYNNALTHNNGCEHSSYQHSTKIDLSVPFRIFARVDKSRMVMIMMCGKYSRSVRRLLKRWFRTAC